ncbi:hypothetical protein CYMTET_17163 [Cymbomonas tetramitiformis]|uniref:Major facilitator superfamily (MFS) profile domain-containing protein n=1 Tax=Cymbomonas tetramitiformis TaxID=36881 RepID=A0AAE0GAX0_9CHLO|nr:hypothetical protein CYMTET_17163 [Cymbomonas tetramitiformis]
MDLERAKASEEEVDARIKPLSKHAFLLILAPAALLPLLPKAADDLLVGTAGLATLNVVHGLFRFLANFPSMLAAERYGRSQLLHAAPILNLVGALASFFSLSYGALIFTSAMMGVGLGITMLVTKLNVADVSTPATVVRAKAPIITSQIFARAIGPLLAGPIAQSFGLKSALIFQVLVCIVALGYGKMKVPETLEKRCPELPSIGQMYVEYKQSLNTDVILVLTAVGVYSMLFLGLLLQGIPVLCHDYCPDFLEPGTLGLIWVGITLLPALFVPAAGHAGLKVGHQTVILAAGIVQTISIFFVGSTSVRALIMVWTGLASIAYAVVMVSAGAHLVNVAPTPRLAYAISLLTFAADIGGVCGPILVEFGGLILGRKFTFQANALAGVTFSALFVYYSSENQNSSKDKSRIPLPAVLLGRKKQFAIGIFAVYFSAIYLTLHLPMANHDFDHGPMEDPRVSTSDPGRLFVSDAKEDLDTEWAAYRTVRDRCKWKTTLASEQPEGFCYQKWPTKEIHKEDPDRFEYKCDEEVIKKREKFLDGINFKDCEESVNPDDPTADVWRIQRIGPMTSVGGYDWHSIFYNDPANMKEPLSKNPKLFITGDFIAVTDEGGEPLPYPPIHLHHVHMYNDDIQVPQHFERHGDSACLNNEGAAECLLQVYPEGYGIQFSRPYQIGADLNDVRAADSEVLPWYFEVSFRINHRPVTPISRNSFAMPGDPWSEVTTYELGEENSFLWATFKNPFDQYIWFYGVHVHMSRADEIWVFTDKADDIGLNQGKYVVRDPLYTWESLVPTQWNSSTEEVKAELTRNWEAHLKSLGPSDFKRQQHKMCKLPGTKEWVELPGIGMKAYDRHPVNNCLGELSGDWKKGDLISIVAFNEGKPGVPSYPQHTVLWSLGHQYGLPVHPWSCSANPFDQPIDCLPVPIFVLKVLCETNPKWHTSADLDCPPEILRQLFIGAHEIGIPFQ